MAENQGKTKKHPETEILLFENYLLYSSTASSKHTGGYSKNAQKTSTSRLMAMKMRLGMKNRSHRYDINRPRPRHGHKYTKY